MEVGAHGLDLSDLDVNPREIQNYHIQPRIELKVGFQIKATVIIEN